MGQNRKDGPPFKMQGKDRKGTRWRPTLVIAGTWMEYSQDWCPGVEGDRRKWMDLRNT